MEPVSESDTRKGSQKKETKEILPEKQNGAKFVRAEIFGGKLKVFRKGYDPNDPKNYRDPSAEELEKYEERSKISKIPIPDINITTTTNTGTSSMSGTAIITPDIKFNVPIPKVGNDKTEKKVEVKVENNEIKVKVDNDKTKEKKEEADLTDPYNWYINENLRLKK